MVHKVAWELGKNLQEVREMPVDEFVSWVAYFRIVDEDNARAAKRAQSRIKG